MRKTKKSATVANRDFQPWAGERCVDLPVLCETYITLIILNSISYFWFMDQNTHTTGIHSIDCNFHEGVFWSF